MKGPGRSLARKTILLVAVLLWLLPGSDQHLAAQTDPAQDSVANSLEYLRRAMDQFHNRFPVYDDVSSAGNHFHAWAKIPDQSARVSVNGSWTTNPHSGATAIRCQFDTGGVNYGGFYFLNGLLPPGATVPQPNFGTVPNAGVDLSGAVALSLWARGERGGEQIEFFVAGVGRDPYDGHPVADFPDSSPRAPRIGTVSTLTTNWQRFSIDLSGLNLSYVLGGFGWVVDGARNPAGAVFYLDDIQYDLSDTARQARLNQPHFIKSFTTQAFQSLPPPVGDFDFVLRNSAFTYDNAVALLAFLADGSDDSIRRARLIGNAFVAASTHDRTFDDGRLRSDYAAGDISLPPGWTPNGRIGTVPIPGFYIESQQRFVEIEQGALDTGNNAWAMIALLALYQLDPNEAYLRAALGCANFIQSVRNDDTGTYLGFLGGITNPEGPIPMLRTYASTEHNLDVYAAFTTLSQITGDPSWLDGVQHAQDFVEDMWDSDRGCYLAGTLDPDHRNMNPNQLPLDVQAWSTLAIPDVLQVHPTVLACAEQHHRTTSDGFSGFDFNDDRDGIWFEGTGQMSVAYAFASEPQAANAFRQELRRAQATPPFGDGFGIAAASHDGVTTGFQQPSGDPLLLFRRLHVADTAWNIFAQLSFNPFTEALAPSF